MQSRDRFEQQMSDEMRFHIEEHTRELIRQGLSPADAERQARIDFGSVTVAQEDCRESKRWHLLDGLSRDLRYSFRALRKSPGFTATAIAILALCLGANLAIFAIVDAVLLKPLPFPDSQRIVTMYNTYPKAGVPRDGSSLANYVERRQGMQSFEHLSMYAMVEATLGEAGNAERVPALVVTKEFFQTLGVQAVEGRAWFREEEMRYGGDRPVIVTHALRNQSLRINGSPAQIVGVLPPGFRFLSSEAQFFLPLRFDPRDATPDKRHSGGNVKQIIARLKPGVSVAAAQAEIDQQNANAERQDPMARMMVDAGFRTPVIGLQADYVEAVRPALILLEIATLVLLLIGIVNLANLLLIRAAAKARELGVRQALGAGKWHVVREAFVETLMLSFAGAVPGLVLGWLGIAAIERFASAYLPTGTQIPFDLRVAVMGFALVILIALALALPITWFSLQADPQQALRSGDTRTATGATQRLRHTFVIAQIALAFVMLTGAGLLGMSLKKILAVDPGFTPGHMLTGKFYVSRQNRQMALDRIFTDLRQQPGMIAVATSDNIPFSGDVGKAASIPKGYIRPAGQPPQGHYAYSVDGDYFTALGYRLVEGRFLTAGSRERACVVDRDFAQYYWRGQSALGRLIFIGPDQQPDEQGFRIVGVVEPVRQAGFVEAENIGAVYYPGTVWPVDDLYLVTRSSAALPPDVLRRAAQAANLPISDVQSMDNRMDQSLAARKSPAFLAGLFASLALLLTAVGTYGVISYAASQRKREIGIRMALGADPGQIQREFLTLALRLIVPGLAVGAAAAMWAGHLLSVLLYEVSVSANSAIIAAAIVVLGGAALLACWIPSQRASRLSPASVLTAE